MKLNRYKFSALVFWLAGIVAMGLLYVVGGVSPPQMANWLQQRLASLGLWGPWVYMGGYSLRSLVLFPASLLTIMGGILFGPWWGMLYTIIGENLSANLSFLVARYLGSTAMQRIAGRSDWLTRVECEYRHHGFLAVLIMRLMFVPFDIVGYSAGACRLRQSEFALGTFLGTLPGLAIFILVGSAFTHSLHLLLAIAIFVIALTISHILRQRAAPGLAPFASGRDVNP